VLELHAARHYCQRVLWVEDVGSGPAVVLIHNGVMDSRTWNPQFRPFAERHRVVRYDCPGFGRTPPAEEPYRETDVLRRVLDDLGIESAALVGGSRGGRIALDFTLAEPERVSALALVCGGVSGYRLGAYSDEQAAREEAAIAENDWGTVVDVTLEVWGRLGPGDGVRELALANARAELLTEHEQPPERTAIDHLEEVAVPTLVITCGHDAPQLNTLAEVVAARIPEAEHVDFGESDHFPNMREPERFNRVVLDWLSR
jgi:3-oxoadipate enol-lactonase